MLKIPHLSILIFSIYSTQKKVLNDNKSSSNSSDHIMRYNRHFSNIHQTLPNNITLHNKNIDEVGKIFIEKQVMYKSLRIVIIRIMKYTVCVPINMNAI